MSHNYYRFFDMLRSQINQNFLIYRVNKIIKFVDILYSYTGLLSYLGMLVNVVLEVVILRQHRLGNDVIKLDRERWEQRCFGRLCYPCELGSLLEILGEKTSSQIKIFIKEHLTFPQMGM